MSRLLISLLISLVLSAVSIPSQGDELLAVITHAVETNSAHSGHDHTHSADHSEVSVHHGKLVVSHSHGNSAKAQNEGQNDSKNDNSSKPHRHSVDFSGGVSLCHLEQEEVSLTPPRGLPRRLLATETPPVSPFLSGLFRPPKASVVST